MGLYRIQVIVEASDLDAADIVADSLQAAICPHPPEIDHSCPMRWMISLSEMTEQEADEWREALND